jgi:hypothetical protein
MNHERRRSPSRRKEDLTRERRQEEEIASIQRALQDAWLNKYGVTRLVRWVMMLLASAFISLFIVDAVSTPADRRSCDRRQDIFRIIVAILDGAANQQTKEAEALREDLPRSRAAHEQNLKGAAKFRAQAAGIRKNIVEECDAEYNHLPPFNLFLD